MKTQKYMYISGIALLVFFNLGVIWGLVVNATPRPLYPREKDPVPILQKSGWAPGPVWAGAENLAPAGIQFPDRPARSESLYRQYHGMYLQYVKENCGVYG
jgi:hypothetical protein